MEGTLGGSSIRRKRHTTKATPRTSSGHQNAIAGAPSVAPEQRGRENISPTVAGKQSKAFVLASIGGFYLFVPREAQYYASAPDVVLFEILEIMRTEL
ncbi:hypothetical protein BHE74_00032537 [Ensete ventricosum]|uniref:Uncharacterized protein n=1 Tax=Ensete ventricosum TaxID=4639 RepID=A0A445MA61_ENSVE|nr:hypothetical protein BHE74_00032537 [Ensete ventricosum]RZR71127.1 hypothetical protein BHM03_00003715 [Ensete ventricosum]